MYTEFPLFANPRQGLSYLQQRYSDLECFCHDAKQAYLQSNDQMTTKIHLQPKEEDIKFFNLKRYEALELLNPLYGVCDVGDYWKVTLIDRIERDLLMIPHAGDISLYMREYDGSTEGMLGAYVENCLLAGNENFQKLAKRMPTRF